MNTIGSVSYSQSGALKASVAVLPVALFGSVMGLAGLSLAWRAAHGLFGTPEWVGAAIGWVAIVAFVAMTLAYGLKALTAFDSVRAEFDHPVAGNMFGTPLISLLLLPILLAQTSLPLARLTWSLGALGMTVFAWFAVSRWMNGRQNPAHAAPAWIIPVVGMIDVPLALPSLQWPGLDGMMIFFLAIGLFFAIPIFTMIFSRIVFQEPMPAPMRPSLLIMVAPFAVGFSSYAITTGRIDDFAEALYMLMLFMLAVLGGRLRNLLASCPFRLSWWAVSFPLSASAGAALRYAGHAQSVYADGIGVLLLAIATAVILGLLGRTLFGIVRGELRTLVG